MTAQRKKVVWFFGTLLIIYVGMALSYKSYLDDLEDCRRLCPPPNTAIVERNACLCAHPPVPKEK